MIRHIARNLVALFVFCSTAAFAGAQDPGSYCKDAIARASRIGRATNGKVDDIYRLGSCGRDGYRMVGDLLLANRGSHDTGFLNQLLSFVSGPDGLVLLDPLLTVVDDRQATPEARIRAMIGLIQLQSGSNAIRFEDLSDGIEKTTCGSGRNITDQGGHPKTTAADDVRIRAVARRIRADSTAPMEVHTGAACLGGGYK